MGEDMINEGKFARINNLHKSLSDGFFFHFTVIEHINKIDFNAVRMRIPSHNLSNVEDIARDVFEIRKGVNIAYDYNMKMVQIIVNLYSYLNILAK